MFKLTTRQTVVKSIGNVSVTTGKNLASSIEKFEEKVKGTFMENWVRFWKNVYIDYREVVFDVGRDMKEKPVKAVCIVSFLGSTVFCFKHNPSEVHFRDALIQYENQLLLVHPSMHNPDATQHLKYVQRCYNNGSIRRLNLGVASIIWTDYYNKSCTNYCASCPHLQVRFSAFKDRVLDIGFLNRWWILTSKMKNYDVNEIL